MENANKNSIYQLNEDYYNESEYKVNELIEEARVLLEKKDFKQAEFYLNLAKLEPRMDLNNKIKCFGMTSIIRQSHNDETNIIEFIMKIFKYLKDKSIKLMDVPTAYFIIRIFYRAGIIMHLNQNFFLSVFFLKYSKNLIIEKGLEGEEKNKESLDKLIEDNINKIKIHVTYILISFKIFFTLKFLKILFTKKLINLNKYIS